MIEVFGSKSMIPIRMRVGSDLDCLLHRIVATFHEFATQIITGNSSRFLSLCASATQFVGHSLFGHRVSRSSETFIVCLGLSTNIPRYSMQCAVIRTTQGGEPSIAPCLPSMTSSSQEIPKVEIPWCLCNVPRISQ